MSIASELNALNGYILGAYDEIDDKGGMIPQNKNMANLASSIASISGGGGGANNNLTEILEGTTTELYDNDATFLRTNALYTYDGRDAYLTSVSFPNVETIGERAFSYQQQLLRINLPKLEKLSGAYNFENCAKLEELRLPLLKTVDYTSGRLMGTFQSCTAIEKIDLGNNSIALNGVFYNLALRYCNALKALILRYNSVLVCTLNPFPTSAIANGTGYIYVPSSLVSSYKSSTYYSNYASQIRAIEDYSDDGTVEGDINV